MNIMMVDDSPTQRALWMYALSAAGVQVVTADDASYAAGSLGHGLKLITAKDGEQAIGLLQERRFEVVITDIEMPGINGWQLAAKAQALDPRLQVIIVSSKVTTGEAPPPPLDAGRTHIVAKAERERAVELVLKMLPLMQPALRQ